MSSQNLMATAETLINASIDKVWDAFTNSRTIRKYMFGTTVISDWKEGSQIIWKGSWKGKEYEDKGVILQLKPKTKIQYTHFSPLTGQPDLPQNYHTVTIELTNKNSQTKVSLLQDNNANEQEKEHSERNWKAMLEELKKLLEENS